MDKVLRQYEENLSSAQNLLPLNKIASQSAEKYKSKIAMKIWNGNGYDEYSFAEFNENINAISRWMIKNGIVEGDRIAVLGENSPQWGMCYLASLVAGGVVVPVDRLLPASGIRHILHNSESKFLFVSKKLFETIEEMEPVSSIKKYICFEKLNNNDVLFLEDIIKEGKTLDVTLPELKMEDTAAILYTSGTTGHSKGVVLSHENIVSDVANALRVLPINETDTFLSVLPIHHSYECTCGFLLPIFVGASITYARSMKSNELLDDMRLTGVTIMLGVPLLFEKMHAGILRGIKKKGKKAEKIVNLLLSISDFGEKRGKAWGVKLFRSLREKAGLGSVKIFISGGGPLSPDDCLFFNDLGIKTFQGYGLTETSPITHLTPPWRIRYDCIGPPIPEVEHKIVDINDEGIGELCVKGPNVFAGYYQNDEATKECFDEEGWFHTGDLAIIHEDNYAQIAGRKKYMLVTSGGKNVYPEEIEHYLSRSELILEALILGVQRDKGTGEEVGALIYPDYEQVDLHFEKLGKKPTEERVLELIKAEVKIAQKELSEYKWVKHLRVMQEEFQKTSSRKIKRYLYSGEMFKLNDYK